MAAVIDASTAEIPWGAHKAMNSDRVRLLFVDDELDLREIVADLCQVLGIELISVENGQQALEVLEKETVDAVFSDFHMPRVNGMPLLARVRDKFPEMPFLFWSGFLDPNMVAQAKRAGDVDFLEKPFSSANLRAAIGRLVSRPRPNRSSLV